MDGNGHLFSGKYGDIVWDCLPEDLRAQPLREFQIHYSKEAVLGEVLHLQGLRDGDAWRVEGLGSSGVCFSAACRFA